ncbi:hypothetical protein [Flavobacterium chungangense]|uniref:SMODS and SLOG-associating 2TM effector domain-containing protein n=1 Tax=Flavobacterium chungangense TaxID=554283 RepID=A0A6V6YVU8_9FLAO|nr:hypothetical protein [Flavobacterium chungangense]CAD0003610.1 hypothetical protein FLACHUCJ7_01499 [Flavobacterium chungangense]
MDNFDFYKNKYERELNRRNYLDGAINNPIIGVTVVVTLNSYIVSKNIFKADESSSILIIIILILTLILAFISVIFIFISVNNLFKGFKYQNFGLLKDFRKFELDLEKFNNELEDITLQKTFKQQTVEKFIQFSDNHTILNDKRALNLYRSRSFIILAVLLTFINLSFVTIINFKMAEENNPIIVPSPPTPSEPPKMPTDRIEKGENPTLQTK